MNFILYKQKYIGWHNYLIQIKTNKDFIFERLK